MKPKRKLGKINPVPVKSDSVLVNYNRVDVCFFSDQPHPKAELPKKIRLNYKKISLIYSTSTQLKYGEYAVRIRKLAVKIR